MADNVNYLLGLLNSKLLNWFICQIAPIRQGGFYELKPTYVKQIPIAKARKTNSLAIEALVQKCLNAKG